MVAAASRVAAAAADTAPVTERAENVLEELIRLVPYVGAQLSSWDHRAGRHRTVAHRGYGEDMLDALNGVDYRNDPGWAVLEAARSPMRWGDCPFEPQASPFYVNDIRARGYAEGLTAPLYRRDGAYVGMLALSTDSARHPDDETREIFEMLAAGLAPLVDLVDSARRYAAMASPGASALVFSEDLVPVSLAPSQEDPPGEMVDAARELLRAGRLPIRFRWPAPTRGVPFSVHLLPCTHPGYPAILSWGRAPVPHALTRRELEVLSGLIEGASNVQIAATLSASPRTVSTHVEHILAKLSVGSRTAAVSIALQHGLFLPNQKYVF